MLTTIKALAITTALLGAAVIPAAAANFEVRLLQDKATGALVFEPMVTKVAVGDTVTFVPTQKGHNVEAIKDMLPATAKTFKGAAGERLAVTFTEPGTYGVKCTPFAGAGMVGLVVVGADPVDPNAVDGTHLPHRAIQGLQTAVEYAAR